MVKEASIDGDSAASGSKQNAGNKRANGEKEIETSRSAGTGILPL